VCTVSALDVHRLFLKNQKQLRFVVIRGEGQSGLRRARELLLFAFYPYG
jgi:hypothetical protein